VPASYGLLTRRLRVLGGAGAGLRRTWPEVLDAFLGQHGGSYHFNYSTLARGTVLMPGKPSILLELPLVTVGRQVHAQIERGRLATRICYCSLYEECWVDESPTQDEPRPVARCDSDPRLEFAR
jgi:hypothetical protein